MNEITFSAAIVPGQNKQPQSEMDKALDKLEKTADIDIRFSATNGTDMLLEIDTRSKSIEDVVKGLKAQPVIADNYSIQPSRNRTLDGRVQIRLVNNQIKTDTPGDLFLRENSLQTMEEAVQIKSAETNLRNSIMRDAMKRFTDGLDPGTI